MKTKKLMLSINFIIIAAIFVLNYFYQLNGFDITLKLVCSGSFAILGLINLMYAFKTDQKNKKFFVLMSIGLIFAFLGDYLIGINFILGAGVFALGHVFFVIAYCTEEKLRSIDIVLSMILFLGGALFLTLCPLLNFDEPIFKLVCIIYALIISSMLGKALGNYIVKKDLASGVIALGSALFFFSDLMLVFDWFIGLWSWTDNACMGTYYPALCLLALSMFLKCRTNKE